MMTQPYFAALGGNKTARCLRQLLTMILLLVSPLSMAQSFFAEESGFLAPDQAFTLSLSREGDSLMAHWEIADEHYLYRHTFEADIDGRSYALSPPRGTLIEDEFFGESEVFHDAVELTLPVADADHVTLTWQGCAEAGLCYPPQQKRIELATLAPSDASPGDTPLASSSPQAPQAEDQQLASRLANAPPLWVLGAFFAMGLLLTFTPCVLPMIPILSSLIIGDQRTAKPTAWRGLGLSLAFVIPMAMTYASLGVAAALAGANLQMLFQAPLFIGIFAAVFVLLAMAMMGVFELTIPQGVTQRLDAALSRVRGGRITGAAAMGVLSAILVGPCMTAPLAGALLYIAETGDAWHGGLALLALGLGMGVPLIAVGTLGPRLLPRPGAWMLRVRVVFGFVLLGMAIWFSTRILPGPLGLALWGALLVGMAIASLQVARELKGKRLATPFLQSLAFTLAAWGLMGLVGAGLGGSDISRPLAQLTPSPTSAGSGAAPADTLTFDTLANQAALDDRLHEASSEGMWTMLEFTADWCITCQIIEREVFGDSEVQRALSDVARLQVDVTDYTADDREIMSALGIIGPPSILFFGPDGDERRHARIIGDIDADGFLRRLTEAGHTTPTSQEMY
ncbi:protein-disulfide reductase DsbD [Franzmannia qiaohouensis]|uniref:Thiol:disulfide interchange protein DsbD n=1 Tax=Franzmannia qiaohouensis TaxID=1329370 RepID=A0ABU1HA65_9GAMM|nr:protein-disulfide reductase DsbD [Halomonas qiaohouensis]MDR5904352.1 protein-disulfide reductase DsbD [Halomonas qiaohouensis]